MRAALQLFSQATSRIRRSISQTQSASNLPDNLFMARLTAAQVAEFQENGFLLAPNLVNEDETRLLLDAARADRNMLAHAFGVEDTTGRKSKLSLWNDPGDDIFGMVSRSARIVDAMEQLLGGEVYHYHSKMMLKEPRVGGAWEWHQDYGYWYQNGCLFPYMASCLIALDRATRENGCLQVLKGSHHMGRIEHGRFGEQTGADPERVQAALERFELVYCEMEPGNRAVFPLQPAPRLRPEHQPALALGPDLLLQRRAQQPVQRVAPPAIHAAQQSAG